MDEAERRAQAATAALLRNATNQRITARGWALIAAASWSAARTEAELLACAARLEEWIFQAREER
jgi:hypothetical protein